MNKSEIPDIRIGQHLIGENHPPYIVAELSGNHEGSLDNALAIIEAAKKAGVHAIKLQTYTPDTITLNSSKDEFIIHDPESLWDGRSLYDLYTEAHMPWDWHAPIFKRCKELHLTAFSTPFDETAVDFLESLNVPCYKIASLEIVDLPLIKKVASTGKPLILSTGAATEEEIAEAVATAREAGCKDLILLKCTTAYPAKPLDSNLNTLPYMKEKYHTLVGLSDHCLGIGVAAASIALGACLIEKHMTLSRETCGVDGAFSLEPKEMQALVVESERAWQALGKVYLGKSPAEQTVWALRPSLYVVQDIKAGTTLTASHIRSVRPGAGLPPKEYDHVIGKTVKVDIEKGTPLSWDQFSKEV